MSWGTGIAITMGAFMVFILSFVYRSSQQDLNLVTKDYYEESLVYDEVQTKHGNYSRLNDSVTVDLKGTQKLLNITLPASFDEKVIKGTISLYYAADEKQDKAFALKEIHSGIATNDLKPGLWKIKVDWTSEEIGYLFESSIFINN